MHPMWITFGVTYIGIALGRFPKLVLDRTGIALLGAIAMLVFHGVSVRDAAGHISDNSETLILLFGLMIFSAQLRVAGFYVWAGERLTRLVDRPKRLLAGLIAISAILSALLANDIVCLAFTPLLCEALLAARRDPMPFLLALATSSNIGSAATIIGNPQNMYIGTVAHLPFGHFSLVMIPIVLVGLAICWGMIVCLFGERLGKAVLKSSVPLAACPPVLSESESFPRSDHRHSGPDFYLITKTLIVLAALVAFFLTVHGQRQSELRAIATLAGAAILLISRRDKAAKPYRLVDWNLLLLFIGLFVVNGALKQIGLTDDAMGAIAARGVKLDHPISLSTITVLLSNLVSNVPAVLLLQPSLTAAASVKLWYLLALVSTWAGNLTLVGSIANLIVAESASVYGVTVDLKTYCLLGVPLTIVTVILGTTWVMGVM